MGSLFNVTKPQCVLVVLVVMSLTACTRSFIVDTSATIPAPLITPLPLQVALVIPQQTRHHTYRENTPDRPHWTITTGPSQVALLETLFSALFLSVQIVDQESYTKGQFQVSFTPTLKDMQFSLPSETGLPHYEVWMLYDISMQTPTGEEIAKISVSGYGKEATDFLNSKEEGVQVATNNAFRDLAARTIIELRAHPEVKRWLATQQPSG